MAITVEKAVAKKQTREFIRFPCPPAAPHLLANNLRIAGVGRPAGVSLTMPDFTAEFKGPKEGFCFWDIPFFSPQKTR